MRARQLEVFVAVMRAGTVTQAAKTLNISQPALSQVLRHAEDELGFLLFDREKGRLHPTPEALELYPEAERLFGGLEGLRRKTSDLRLGRAGLVRISGSTPPAMSLLPQVLAEFRARHPDIALRCNVAPLAAQMSMLREGDVSMALALTDHAAPDIEAEVLSLTSFCCLMTDTHPLATEREITFEQLSEQFLISYRSETQPFDVLERAAQQMGAVFAPSLEIDTSISVVGFVQAGLGIAVVDSLLPWAQFADLVIRPLAEAPDLPLSLLTLRGKTLSMAEELMRAQIRALAP